MKKYILPAVLLFFITSSIVFAADNLPQIVNYLRETVFKLQKDVAGLKGQNFGKKIADLETKLAALDEKSVEQFKNLETKIDNLEQQIASSKSLKIYDSTGKEIGYLIDYDLLTAKVFDININKIYTIELNTAKVPGSNPYSVPVFGLLFSLSENCNGPFAVNKKLSPYDIAHQNSDPFLGFYSTKSYDDLQKNVQGKSVKNEDGTCTNETFVEDYASIIEPIKLPTYVGPLKIKF